MAAERKPLMAAADGPPPGVGWARRLLWRVWPDRNPLRRAADRAERALLVVLFALFAAGIPAAALAVGHWAGTGAARAARVVAATQRPVSAHLLHSAPPAVGPANPSSYLVSSRPGGPIRRGCGTSPPCWSPRAPGRAPCCTSGPTVLTG